MIYLLPAIWVDTRWQ